MWQLQVPWLFGRLAGKENKENEKTGQEGQA